tara:strand:- start:62 stop:454 length:393 start_codon:yes stop_codon:yes gene_type:complete
MSNNFLSVPISIGELCDKYTILKIKMIKITNKDKLDKIKREYDYLTPLIEQYKICDTHLDKLKDINSMLWNIEDSIRIKESNNEFDDEFIQIARSVYITNDRRFEIKNIINSYYNSDVCEVKSYASYTSD